MIPPTYISADLARSGSHVVIVWSRLVDGILLAGSCMTPPTYTFTDVTHVPCTRIAVDSEIESLGAALPGLDTV